MSLQDLAYELRGMIINDVGYFDIVDYPAFIKASLSLLKSSAYSKGVSSQKYLEYLHEKFEELTMNDSTTKNVDVEGTFTGVLSMVKELTDLVDKYDRLELGKTRGFEYLREDFKTLPYRGTRESAGYDFFAPCSFELKPGESVVIATNITAYMLPDEYLAIYPRSGHGFKFFARLANTVGIIDSDFYGNEIKVKIRNESADALLKIEKGQAFCQGIFQNYLLADGDSFTEGSERTGGFGSTDK